MKQDDWLKQLINGPKYVINPNNSIRRLELPIYIGQLRVDELNDILHERADYNLFGTVLADSTDVEVAKFMEECHTEINAITGKDCCFIYLRDVKKAKRLVPFKYSEHAQHAYDLAKLFGVDFQIFPCLFFFKEIVPDDLFQFDGKPYVYISLKGLSQQQIVILMRQIFDHLHHNIKSTPLNQLSKFKHAQARQITKQELMKNAAKFGEETFASFLRSFILGLLGRL